MVKIFEFTAPESMRLSELSPKEAEEYATAFASKALDSFRDVRPVGVNVLALSQRAADVGGWVQWTRACCGHRDRIDDFTEPIVSELDIDGARLPADMQGVHLESQLRSVRLQGLDHVAE